MARFPIRSNRRKRRSKILPFILGSILFHLLLLAIFILTNIELIDQHAKEEKEEPEYIEITELPVPKEKETKPPEKPKRLAERSHIAPEEKTRDDFTKQTPAVPPQPPVQAQPKPKPQEPKKAEKKEETKVAKKPKEAEKKEPSARETLLRDDKLASLPREELKKESKKSKPAKDPSEITREDLFRESPSSAPQRQRNPQDFLGARDVEKKEDTVDLSTTEFKYLSYFLKLKSKVESVWTYPKESRYRGEQGTLFLVFTLASNGELIDIQLITSSGHARLDNEAFRALKAGSRYAPFPKSWGGLERLNIRASFTYGYGGFIR